MVGSAAINNDTVFTTEETVEIVGADTNVVEGGALTRDESLIDIVTETVFKGVSFVAAANASIFVFSEAVVDVLSV